MTTTETMTHADAALTDIERIIARLVSDPAARESILCAVEMYGDARSDEALSIR